LACAAALATLAVLRDENWPQQVATRGAAFGEALQALAGATGAGAVRGMGLLWGIELLDRDGAPDAPRAFAVVCEALRRGVLLLADGTERNVLAFTPPFCLEDAVRDAAFDIVGAALASTAANPGGQA
jgi:4-aminobutyrate aminotransferase